MLGTVLIFFPYQKALRIVSQNLMGSSTISVALDGPRFGFASVQVARIVIGHAAVQGKPLFEIKKIDARWNPLSLLTGKLSVFCRAVAYDGTIETSIESIPVFAGSTPSLRINFTNVNLAKYPEATLPWFKSLSGKLSGWIREEIPFQGSEKQKGTFRVVLAAGEINQMQVKGLENLVLPYKEVITEGRIAGSKIYLDKIVVDGEGVVLKGNGSIERAGLDTRLAMRLTSENSSSTSVLANGTVITVTGNQWHPAITISTEPEQKAEKKAAWGRNIHVVRLFRGGTSLQAMEAAL